MSDINTQTSITCEECNRQFSYMKPDTSHKYGWCIPCNKGHFEENFNNWTSGNLEIDQFIQSEQISANDHFDVIEWIPFAQFTDLEKIGEGGFATVYKTIWKEGRIRQWNVEI